MAEPSKIRAFLDALKAFQDQDDASFTTAVAAVEGPTGLVADFARLLETIEKLKASQGDMSAEDQALAAEALTKAQAFSGKLGTFSSQLKAMDEAQAPEAPTV